MKMQNGSFIAGSKTEHAMIQISAKLKEFVDQYITLKTSDYSRHLMMTEQMLGI